MRSFILTTSETEDLARAVLKTMSLFLLVVNDQKHKELMVQVLALVHSLKSLASTKEPVCRDFSLTGCSTAMCAAPEPVAQLHSENKACRYVQGQDLCSLSSH